MAPREQERARFALERVNLIKIDSGRERYKTQLLKLPARLHTSGLGQTVAFYLSAGPNKPEAKICDWLQEWLGPGRANIYPQGKSLIQAITEEEPRSYRRAAGEVRALAVWLKRFAEAFIEDQHGTRP